MTKFLKTQLKCNGVVESSEWTSEYLKPIQDFVDSLDSTRISVNDVGLDSSDTLIFIVDFYGNTKKECDALFSIFKSDLVRLLKRYGLTKIDCLLKAYGDKLF